MEKDRELIILVANRHRDAVDIQFIRDAPDTFTYTPLSGGSSNVVYLVQSQNGEKRVVFKYAPSVIKNFEGTQLTPRRVDIDVLSLEAFNNVCPSSAPHVFCFDPETHSFFMEYMEGYESLTQAINIRNHADLEVAKRLGEIIATVHKGTWVANMTPEEASKMKDKFIIDEITEVKIEFDFLRGLDETFDMKLIEPEALETFREIQKDGCLDNIRDYIVDMVRNKQQCLVHNDYYPGSVMAKGLDLKVYDMEFASITAAGADTGLMAIFYIMGYVRGVMEQQKEAALLYITGTDRFLESYMDHMAPVLLTDESKREMVEDTALFAGWFLLSMTSFKEAHFHMRLSPQNKIVLWKIGKILLMKAKALKTMKDLVNLVEKNCFDLTS